MANTRRLTAEEARHVVAEHLGLPQLPSRALIGKWHRTGVGGNRLPAVRLGRLYFDRGELLTFLDQHVRHPNQVQEGAVP